MHLFFFFSTYILFYFSIIGWGVIFNKFVNLKNFEISRIGISGLVLLTFISYITTFFFPHGFFFNLILHSAGIYFFFLNVKKIDIKSSNCIIIILLFIALLISKNHDDFPFYHLQQSLNLSQNKFQIGLSNLDFSFSHHSSLFFLNSLFYIPYFKFYLFNAPNLILYTFVIIFLYEEFKSIQTNILNNIDLFSFYFIVFSCSYILIKFSRLSEFGTDLIGQLLIILLIYLFINKAKIVKDFIFIHLILLFCFTIKTYFIVYCLFYLYFIYLFNFSKYIKKIFKFKFFIFFSFLFFFLFILINILTTGCLIYPITYLCNDNFLWSMSLSEVKSYANWYEKWAKGIAGTGYILDQSDNYLLNYSWINNWFNIYFKKKILENLILYSVFFTLFFILFKCYKKRNFYFDRNLFVIFSINFFILLFWFFNYPTLRYGGHAVLFIFFAFLFCYIFSSVSLLNVDFVKIKKISQFIIFFSFFLFLLKNGLRINNEFKRNDNFKYDNFPYFYIPHVNYNKFILNDNVHVYESIDNNCWGINTPCTTSINNLKAKKKYSYTIFYRNK